MSAQNIHELFILLLFFHISFCSPFFALLLSRCWASWVGPPCLSNFLLKLSLCLIVWSFGKFSWLSIVHYHSVLTASVLIFQTSPKWFYFDNHILVLMYHFFFMIVLLFYECNIYPLKSFWGYQFKIFFLSFLLFLEYSVSGSFIYFLCLFWSLHFTLLIFLKKI